MLLTEGLEELPSVFCNAPRERQVEEEKNDLDFWVVSPMVHATVTLSLVVELQVFSSSSGVVQKGHCVEGYDALA